MRFITDAEGSHRDGRDAAPKQARVSRRAIKLQGQQTAGSLMASKE
jgi:hypothetical protein